MGGKLEKAAWRRPAYSQMIRLQVSAAPHIESHLALLDVGWVTAFQAQIAEDAGKWSKGGRGTFFFPSVSSPLSEETYGFIKGTVTRWDCIWSV